MMKCVISGLLIIISVFNSPAQQITMLDSGRNISLRGLSVVSNQIIWVSGSSGTVALSVDGGHQWKWMKVPNYSTSDFRDIHAFSEKEAVIMGITLPAVILRTGDGGESWTLVFEDSSKSVFLDAMDFNGNQGIVVGDPDQGRIFFSTSTNRGKSWKKTAIKGTGPAETGEAFFASSGTNIKWIPSPEQKTEARFLLVSGGKKSSLYLDDRHFTLNLLQGTETTGANSIAINPEDTNQAYIVGGDFSRDNLRQGNSLRIQLNPFIQTPPITPPQGYRSCVEYMDGKRMICCGTSGVDVSTDGGIHWKYISPRGFHVCSRSPDGKSVFLAGPKGTIARVSF